MPNNKKVIVSGSWAYDHIMNYDGLFRDAILPEKLDHLSVAFMASQRTIHYGGCAGNIAYNLKLFGVDPTVLGLVGKDFDQYKDWLKKIGVDSSTLRFLDNELTASAYILTDRNQNQMMIFHGGAMLAASHLVTMHDYKYQPVGLVIISPDDPKRMLRLATECQDLKLPYLFDPSQQIANMEAEMLMVALQGAQVLMVNEYEADLLTKKINVSREQLAKMVPVFIETHGEKGSAVTAKDEQYFIRPVSSSQLVDPTGCGDAFRAGVVFGLQESLSIERSCQIGALAATYALEQRGTQNHTFTMADFKKRFEENFGESF